VAAKKVEKLRNPVHLDGRQAGPLADAKVHVLTPPCHYGVAVFEGIRATPSLRPRGHLPAARARAAPLRERDICLMEMPFSKEQVLDACRQVMVANKMNEGYLRPIAYYADGLMGVGP